MTAGEAAGGDYKDVVLFLATAGVVAPILRRWKISPVLGFLAAGVLLGPFGLGALHQSLPWLSYLTIESPLQVAHLAELGVVFLLFMIGLELSWDRLWTMRRLVFGLGGLQMIACATAIAVVATLLGLGAVSATALGMALALSSTAIVMPLLAEQKRQHSMAGRATFSVLLLQDLAVAPILVTIALLGSRQDSDLSFKLLMSFAPAAFGLPALVALDRLVLRPMMRSVARADSPELFMAASLLVVIGAGLATAMVRLSMALGAFIAGLLLAAGGEFSFVVLQSAMAEKLLDRTLGQTILVASTLSMFAIPILAAIGAAVRTCPGGQPGSPRAVGSASRDLKRSREKSRCKGRSAARGEKNPGDAPDKRRRPSPPLAGIA
jgi:CPA2 family monovalent cation:H+ antiporter-2